MALILVIDDAGAMRALVRRMLERANHVVIEAEDGEVGLAVFEERYPAVVITDLLMPKKDGIEVIRHMRRSRPSAKIIAISGGAATNTSLYLDAASKLGADIALAKPFPGTALLEAVDRLLAA